MSVDYRQPSFHWRSFFGGLVMGIFSSVFLIFWGHAVYQHINNEKLVGVTITQSNHLEVIRTKPDALTHFRLDACHDQQWDLHSCEDYEVVMILNSSEERFTKGNWRSVQLIDVYMNVKQPFTLNLKYKGQNKENKVLYVKLDPTQK